MSQEIPEISKSGNPINLISKGENSPRGDPTVDRSYLHEGGIEQVYRRMKGQRTRGRV